MVKEEKEEEVNDKEQKKEQPKKIIKKMPFKLLKGAKNEDEDLKNWKPMKIT